jgi:membrane protein YdbS with pleckstrin-like domain
MGEMVACRLLPGKKRRAAASCLRCDHRPMQVIDMTEGRPHPNLAVLWRLHALLLGLAAGAVAWLVAWPIWVEAFGLRARSGLGRSAFVGLAVWIAVSWLLLWRAQVAARVYRWQRRPGEGVVVCKGAWWQREVWIPMTRLQHLDIKRGPLERWLGLATLELYTAGSHAYETRLPGLEPQQAQALRDGLLAELQDPAAPGQGAAA